MRSAIVIGVLLASAIGSSAVAKPYVLVASMGDSASLVDMGNIGKTPNGKSYWLVVVNRRIDADGVSRLMFQDEMDCAGKWRTNYIVRYGDDGKSLPDAPSAHEWKPIVPDSVGATIQRYVCGGVRPKADDLLDTDVTSLTHAVREMLNR